MRSLAISSRLQLWLLMIPNPGIWTSTGQTDRLALRGLVVILVSGIYDEAKSDEYPNLTKQTMPLTRYPFSRVSQQNSNILISMPSALLRMLNPRVNLHFEDTLSGPFRASVTTDHADYRVNKSDNTYDDNVRPPRQPKYSDGRNHFGAGFCQVQNGGIHCRGRVQVDILVVVVLCSSRLWIFWHVVCCFEESYLNWAN